MFFFTGARNLTVLQITLKNLIKQKTYVFPHHRRKTERFCTVLFSTSSSIKILLPHLWFWMKLKRWVGVWLSSDRSAFEGGEEGVENSFSSPQSVRHPLTSNRVMRFDSSKYTLCYSNTSTRQHQDEYKQ